MNEFLKMLLLACLIFAGATILRDVLSVPAFDNAEQAQAKRDADAKVADPRCALRQIKYPCLHENSTRS